MGKYKLLAMIGLLLGTFACTDLEVSPYTELTPNNYYKDRTQVIAGVNRIYTHNWNSIGMGGYNRISETSADQLAWTNKGRHGYDNGVHGRQHYHVWTVNDADAVWDPWRTLFTAVGYTNSIMEDFNKIIDFEAVGISTEERAQLEAEIRGMRALYYMKLMDLFGNIPVVTSVGEPVNPPTVPRSEVFLFVENELLEAAKTAAPLDKAHSGRFTLAAAYGALVELYLNSEAWTGTPRWDDCITYCNLLMEGKAGAINGALVLDDNVEDAFSNTNKESSTEIIWSNASDKARGRWINPVNIAHFRERDILNTDYGANNGLIVTPNAIDAYNDNDLRKTSWFMYGIGNHPNQGPYLNISTPAATDYVMGTEEFINLPIIFCNKPIKAVVALQNNQVVITEWYSPEFPGEEARLLVQEAFNGANIQPEIIKRINEGVTEIYLAGGYNTTDPRQYEWSEWNDYRYMWYDCKENSGARAYKYHPGQLSDPNYGNADLVFYRLTDIYFAKAEALMRKGGGAASQEAVDLINSVKARAFDATYWNSNEAVTNKDRYNTASLTMDELLAERGREFVLEAKRRTDLIRFGKFEFAVEGWWDANAGYTDGSGGTISKDVTRRILPIPQNAMLVNPNLVQNPGY